MSKSTSEEDELERRKLSLRLDQELEDTFPASDALKITRTTAGQARKAEAVGAKTGTGADPLLSRSSGSGGRGVRASSGR
jgi:hypothetical protein